MGEVDVALRCGFEPAAIMFTGVGKSESELSRAIALGLKAINVESPGELDRLDRLARAQRTVARVALRVNPDIDARSHPHISTGLRGNKFGVPIDAAPALFREIARRPGLEAVGVHSHIGSQIATLDPLLRAAQAAVDLAVAVRAEGIALRHVDFGGGVGISYDGAPGIDPADYARRLVEIVRPSGLTALVEPGRVLVGPAGALLTRVVDIKQFDGARRFVVLDAGMTELMRPALVRGVPPDRSGGAARRRAARRRHRRTGVREHRHVRAGSAAAAGRGRRRRADSRCRRVRGGDGFDVSPAPAAARDADRPRRRVAGDPAPADARRHVEARGVMARVDGHLIAFEGLDQSGKQTQAEQLLAALAAHGHRTHFLSFPDYDTAIGAEIGRALHGEREYAPDVMQLLYIANRYEYRAALEGWLQDGGVVVCDRYLASSIAYGEAQGLDAGWLAAVQAHLPQPSLTLLLDVAPETSLVRKQRDRDRYERDLQLLARVSRQLSAPGRRLALAAARRLASTSPMSRSEWSARSANDSRCCKRAHLGRAGVVQHPRARFERRTGRGDVVDQHDDGRVCRARPATRRQGQRLAAEREGTADVAAASLRRQVDLGAASPRSGAAAGTPAGRARAPGPPPD